MQNKIRIVGVAGWGLPAKWFSEILQTSFPESLVRVHYPIRPNDSNLARQSLLEPPGDIYIGYSLGSLWLNLHKNHLPNESKLVLLAPILNYPLEGDLGGKIPMAKLRLLIKQIKFKSDYLRYVLGFLNFCGIKLPESYNQEIPSRDDLLEGLEFLKEVSITQDSSKDIFALVGDSDSSLDGPRLKVLMPKLEIIKGVGHDPVDLVKHLQKHFIFPQFDK